MEERDTVKLETLGIVVPVFNEQDTIEAFHQDLSLVIDTLHCQVQIYYINDGSEDRTGELLNRIALSTPHVTVVDLVRNFGHQAALTAGLDVAEGDAIITLDADGQHPPSLIPEMVRLCESGYDVVQTQRIDDRALTFKKVTSAFFYRLINLVSNVDIPSGAADFRLLSRHVVESLKAMRESHRFLRGMIAWMGYPTIILPYKEPDRIAGKSKYSIRKMMRLAQEALFSFSIVPLRISLFIGILLLLISGFEFVHVLLLWIRGRQDLLVPGWSSLMIMVLLIGAFVLISLSIIGIYIGYIFQETKKRPIYLIRNANKKSD